METEARIQGIRLMITSNNKTRLLNLALAAVLAANMSAAVFSVAEAADAKPQAASNAKASSGAGNGTSAASDTSDWPVVHRGKIKKVTVKTSGGTGCHDHENQVSTPGAC
jgi:hypothetical protein